MYILINKTELKESMIFIAKIQLCQHAEIHVNTFKKDVYENNKWLAMRLDVIKSNKRANNPYFRK
jgi:hypothetical protein